MNNKEQFEMYKNSLKLILTTKNNTTLEDCLISASFDYTIAFYNRDIFSKLLYYYRNKKDIVTVSKTIDDFIHDEKILEVLKSIVNKLLF